MDWCVFICFPHDSLDSLVLTALLLRCIVSSMSTAQNTDPQRVHIVDRDGKAIYSGLTDNGGEVLPFTGIGFVTRSQCKRYGWTIKTGWVTFA